MWIRSRAPSGPAALALVLLVTGASAAGAPTTLTVSGTITAVEGSYVGAFAAGQPFSGTFTYDTDESNADPGAITTPSTVPGHEFSSAYDFSDPAYGVALSFPAIPDAFASETVRVVVNDDLALTADETNGAVGDGTYDWIEILGATTVSICLLPGGACEPDEFSPADGEEWTLALFTDPSWISDGSLIPDELPATYTALLVGVEIDPAGVETGVVFADVAITAATTPSVPALGGFASLGLAALVLGAGAASIRSRSGRDVWWPRS